MQRHARGSVPEYPPKSWLRRLLERFMLWGRGKPPRTAQDALQRAAMGMSPPIGL